VSVAAVGTVCLVVAILGIAAIVAFRRRRPVTIVTIALAVVLLVGAYQSAGARSRHLHWPYHAAPATAAPPAKFRKNGYARLAHLAAQRIPPRGTYALVPVTPQGSSFWLRYVLAPRIRTDPSRTHWVLVLGGTPAAAGVTPRRSWKFGNNWLVHT
jgi:hypothetical protein